ncbi:hypothetical protein IJ103_01905, partial [Candidatus Saccharibacteria bacterium]|nr:hypothetical protein [Candidatus Saccharibacteria bacterium]
MEGIAIFVIFVVGVSVILATTIAGENEKNETVVHKYRIDDNSSEQNISDNVSVFESREGDNVG